jgi:PAS domain S-box-containing protein
MAEPKILFNRRLGLALLSVFISLALFVVIASTLGKGMAIASIIPVVVIAWEYGFRAGIWAGALSAPVNIGLCMLIGLDWVDKFYVNGVGVAGTLIDVFVGAVVGKVHDYYHRLQDELDVRKVLESELQQLRTLELTQAEHTLRASEGRFQAIAENSPDAIIITGSNGIITYCNRATEKMFACGQEELVGQHSSTLLAPHVREREATNRAAYLRAGEGGIVCSTFESIGLRKDGTEFPIEFPFFSWKTDDELFYTAIIRDISERKRAENETRQSRDYLETIFQVSPDAILVGNAAGSFVMANQSVYDVYGYRPEELVGKHGSILAPEDEQTRQNSYTMLNELFEKGIIRNYVIDRKHKDGRIIQVEASQVLLKNPDGSFAGSVSATRDITDRKRFEQELRQSRDYLENIFRVSPDAFMVTNTDGYVVMANESVFDVYGYTPEEIIGEHASIFPADDEQAMQVAISMVDELFEAGIVRNFVNTRKRKDGRIIQTESSVVLLKNADGSPAGSISSSRDVTDRIRLEDQLRKSLDYLENIFRASPEAIFVTDDAGYIVMANDSICDVYGYTPEEIAGQHVSLLATEDEKAVDRSMLMLEELFETGLIRNYVIEQKRKDGRIIQTEASHVLLKNPDGSIAGSISSSRDITDRKMLEERLRQSRDYLENIFKASPDAITVADDSGYIVMANDSMFDVYGYRPEEIIGQHVSIFHPDDEPELQKTIKMIEELFEAGIVRNFVAERKHKDGRIIQVEVSHVALKNPDGSVAGSVSSTRDITDRKRSEEQLRQSQKMEAIGTLAGGIAHDFNNILAVIMGYTELSRDLSKGNGVLEKNLSQVLKSVERAKALVRQILAFSRKTKGEVKPLHMHLVITEALKLLRASLPSTISMRSDIDQMNDVVVADATEIYQIVMNLCTNAAYAMKSTGGIIELTLKPVDLDASAADFYTGIGPGPYVQLSVKDTGMGIPRDIIGRIFEPFFTTKEVGKGTGMGLAVVHGIVKSCKGDIKVYSEPGKGAVFHIVLPRAQAERADMLIVEQEAPQGSESVLLVDDEAILLDVGKKTLSSLGYRVTAIGSGVEALEVFKKNPGWFDVVITDQTMPQLTGYELARQLMQVRPDIPIILCTGYSDLVTAESAIAGGIRAFVIKPLTRLAIAETIRKVLLKKAT